MTASKGILALPSVLFLAAATLNVRGGDVDGDGMDDAFENELLGQLAPKIITGADNGAGGPPWQPLNVAWAVSRSRLNWYVPGGPLAGSTGAGVIDMDSVLAIISQHESAEQTYNYHLTFKNPADWTGGPGNVHTLYGRATPLIQYGHLIYRLQYFMFFGFNDTDTPADVGCYVGEHEGDWIGMEFQVEASGSTPPRILRAVLHNHGRQAFIDAPSTFSFDGLHPIICLERGANEPWAWAAGSGFMPGEVPACVGTNLVFVPEEHFDYQFGGECCDWSAVREHPCDGPQYLLTNVINLGEGPDHPMDHPEAQFIQGFPGRYGDYAVSGCVEICLPCIDECCIGPFCFPCPSICCFQLGAVPTDCPPGPPYQCEMWRTCPIPPRDPAWPGCVNIPQVYANAGAPPGGSGSPARPFNKLGDAESVVAAGGSVILQGATPFAENLTLFKPLTVVSQGGSVTIGN